MIYSRRSGAKRVDWMARKVITVGGLFVVASVIAILFFLFSESVSLFRSPKILNQQIFDLKVSDAEPIWLGVKDDPAFALILYRNGVLKAVELESGRVLPWNNLQNKIGEAGNLIAASSPTPEKLFFASAERIGSLPLEKEDEVIFFPLALRHGEKIKQLSATSKTIAVLTTSRLLLLGEGKSQWKEVSVRVSHVSAIALHDDSLAIGTKEGEILFFRWQEGDLPKEEVVSDSKRAVPVTILTFLSGGTLLVGFEDGLIVQYGTWQGEKGRGWIQIRSFAEHRDPIVALAGSPRTRHFLSGDASGKIRLQYTTTHSNRLSFGGESETAALLAFAPKGKSIYHVSKRGLRKWDISDPHPEISWGSLFGKVHYEGYGRPEYVWQSSGGSESFEPKLSLLPLLFGTCKATLYALFFSLPIALFAAIYVSQFTAPQIRNFVKPAIELMAGIPSVVVGLVAALWLAPLLQRFFEGSLLARFFHIPYDPRNSLVIAVALGFAIIPIIFTIAEDALSSVPRHLVSAALALGANRWEAAAHVVIPAALPGIFVAVMLGIGRAIGETMIVLMATGNTPLISWGPFNGMRTLSANIAVELPEAPVGSTLYRVIFLTALLLFLFTFLINTGADFVSVKLKRKLRGL